MMAGPVVAKRKRNLWVAVTVALVASAGVAVWQLWPAGAPAVSVPDRVCAKKLPGKIAADLLPEEGEPYWENSEDGFGGLHEAPTPDCTIGADDREVDVSYFRYSDTDMHKFRHKAEEEVDRVARTPGSTPLRLGEARGYASKHAAVLILNCPMQRYPGTLTASVHGVRGFPSADSDPKAFAELTAETLRLAARDVYKCRSSSALPTGSPVLGRPTSE